MSQYRSIFGIIGISYFLSVSLRFLLAWQTESSPLHTLDGEFLSILTYDAALYGHYAKLLLSGLPHTSDVHLIEYLIYYLVTLTPFSLDEVMYYSPAFLASSIVIPTILIAALYITSKTTLFCIGLLSGIGYGYYSRTYLGYFDTDVLNVFFPMFILYGMVATIKKETYLYLPIIFILSVLYIYWYQSSKPLTYIMLGVFSLYLAFHYHYKYKHFIMKYKYFTIAFFIITSILLINFMDLNIFMKHINRYLLGNHLLNISNFNFLAPMQYISEAKSTNIYFISHLISGNLYIFILSIIGYILLIYKHKEMILSIPLVTLGLLSLFSGIRFHIYSIFIFIISYYFLFYSIFQYFKIKKSMTIFLIILISIPTFYENYKVLNEWNKRAMPVFNPEQVMALNKLNKISQPNDYAVSWWDYGYAIQYYTNLKTMIDNGKQEADTYTVSHILLSDSPKFVHHAIHYFYNLYDKYKWNAIVPALDRHKTPKNLFQKIQAGDTPIKQKNDKYLILPAQMAKLAYTIYTYGNIDPLTGKKASKHTFKMFRKIKEDNKFIYLDSHTKIRKNSSTLISRNKQIKIKTMTSIKYKKERKQYHIRNKGLNLIVQGTNYFIMDDYFYNSALIQMIFFNNYDKKYFIPIYEGSTIVIYKVK